VITVLGYIIAFGGIYISVGSSSCRTCSATRTSGDNPDRHDPLTARWCGARDLGLKFGRPGDRRPVRVRVILLLALSLTILVRAGKRPVPRPRSTWPGGSKGRAARVQPGPCWPSGVFEAAAPLAEETRNPRAQRAARRCSAAVVINGIIYVVGSYALVTALRRRQTLTALASDPNPFPHPAKAFAAFDGAAHHLVFCPA